MKTLLLISFFTEFSGQLFFFTLPLLAIKYGASAQQLGIMSGIYYAYGLYTAFTMEKGRAIAVGMFEAIIGIGVGCGSIAGGFLISILGERAPYIVSMLVGIILSIFQIIETTDKKHL